MVFDNEYVSAANLSFSNLYENNEHCTNLLFGLIEFCVFVDETGRFITTYSAIFLIIVAFVEAQINFCFLSRSQMKHKKEKHSRKSRRPQQYIDNDQTADLEYVIPKVCFAKFQNNASKKNVKIKQSFLCFQKKQQNTLLFVESRDEW